MDEQFIKRLQNQVVRVDVSIGNSLGNGTGLIVNKNTVLTCDHVVHPMNKDPNSIEVKIEDGQSYSAEIIKRDSLHDLALLSTKKLENKPSFTKFDNVRLGSECIVMGYPVRLPHMSISKGIISAKGKYLVSGFPFNLIQVDARINNGNSGGPVFSVETGKVIGIASMKYIPFLEKVEDLQNLFKIYPSLLKMD